MAKKDKQIVVTVAGLSRKEKKKVTNRLVKEVMRDKGYRKAVKHAGKKITSEAAQAAARVAVSRALSKDEDGKSKSVTLATSGLEVYSNMIARFSKARKKKAKMIKKKAKKSIKILKKKGGKFIKKTGLIKLMKADKLPKIIRAKKHKPYKVKKRK